jgi:type IV pilus assembly protein PilQ
VTSRKGLALKPLYVLFSLVLAGTLVAAAGPAGTEPGIVQLKAISARANGAGTSLVIEATGPTAYVTTRPDAFTVYVDFRNVGVGAVSNRFAADSKSPIAAVEVQTTESMGEPVSRVHIKLAQAVGYLVRSDRNRILVDFEKPSTATPYAARPTSERRGDAMAALQQSAVKPDPAALLKSQTNPNAVRAGGNAEPRRSVSEAAAGQQAPASQDPTAQATEQIGTPQAERRFTGNPVSLDFQGADLRAVLRTFSEISSLNIVIDPAVQGTVDVALREVPWDQALDIILRANKLGYLVDGTIVRIAPLAVLADEEAQRRKLAEEQALAGELRLLTKTLSYAKADELKDLLTKSALSPRGTVQVDPRTNTLIITDLGDRLQVASNLIITLDKAQPQVEIEARIVQTNKTFARELGVQWGFMGRVDPALGNTTGLAFPNNGSLGGRVGGVQGPVPTDPVTTGTVPTAVSLGAQAATSGVGLALGSINKSFNLDIALTALERSGNGRLLSTPRVSTQNNIEAEIAQGVQIPYQTVSNNTVTTQFKDAALTLKVTPQITASNTVIMKISVDNGSVGEVLPGGVSINTQRANTTVQVDDGQTTVIGGIYASQEVTAYDRTPGLSSVPLIKWLFKRDHFDDKSTELLIFITPRIIK